MRDPGLIELRRHDPDVVGQRAGDLLNDPQARSMDAVVIGAENSHPSKRLFRFVAGLDRRASSYPGMTAEANPVGSRVTAPAGRARGARISRGSPRSASEIPGSPACAVQRERGLSDVKRSLRRARIPASPEGGDYSSQAAQLVAAAPVCVLAPDSALAPWRAPFRNPRP